MAFSDRSVESWAEGAPNKTPNRAMATECQYPLKGGFAKGEVCRHDFMKVCVEGVQATRAQGQVVFF